MTPYTYQLEQEITVSYPATRRYPRGRELDGVIAKRQNIRRGDLEIHRYSVLFADDTADVMIPPAWIKPRRQVAMIV